MDDVFGALSDPTRRIIISELADRDGQSLFEICGRLSMRHGIGLSRQAISKHLAVLESAGIVSAERVGRTRLHFLRPGGLSAARAWINRYGKSDE